MDDWNVGACSTVPVGLAREWSGVLQLMGVAGQSYMSIHGQISGAGGGLVVDPPASTLESGGLGIIVVPPLA